MSNKVTNVLAKTLIVFALILISFGVYLDFDEKNAHIDPITDVIKIVDKENFIIITTQDGLPPTYDNNNTAADGASDNGSDLVTESTNSTNNSTSSSNSTNSTNNSASGSNSTNSTNSSASGSNSTINSGNIPSNNTSSVASVSEENNKLRKSIETLYGVKILYGSDTQGYTIGSMSTVALSDDEVQSALIQLSSALSVYPSDFFREFANKNLSFYFYLIKRYSANNVTGVTDFSLKKINISIAMDFPFGDSFHHEILHAIEHYINLSGGKFTSWSSLNPNDFSYGNENSNYSYSVTGSPASYFVNNYAQVSQSEDMASTFEYMTSSTRYNCFDSHSYPIWQKSDYLSRMIDTYFTTVTPEVIDYWERYVY